MREQRGRWCSPIVTRHPRLLCNAWLLARHATKSIESSRATHGLSALNLSALNSAHRLVSPPYQSLSLCRPSNVVPIMVGISSGPRNLFPSLVHSHPRVQCAPNAQWLAHTTRYCNWEFDKTTTYFETTREAKRLARYEEHATPCLIGSLDPINDRRQRDRDRVVLVQQRAHQTLKPFSFSPPRKDFLVPKRFRISVL